MRINICETTIATDNVKELKNFYSNLLGDESKFEDHDFYCTVKDKKTSGQISLVPHNGDKRWAQPWLSLRTDDLAAAIEHIKTSGVAESDIEIFGATDESGEPVEGVTFKDPDGRIVMMMSSPEA